MRKDFEALLNDVISILIFNQHKSIWSYLLDELLFLVLFPLDVLHGFLNHPTAIRMNGKGSYGPLHLHYEHLFVFFKSFLKYLLEDVVPEPIRHQRDGILKNCLKDLILSLIIFGLESVLHCP